MTDHTTDGTDPADNAATDGSAVSATVAAQFISADVQSELMDAAIRKAVAARFAKEAAQIADKVVDALLTTEIREQMTETAAHEAELTLNPLPPAAEVVEPDTDEEEDEAPKPQLEYPDVAAFVERYLCNLYRREVRAAGVQSQRRWCKHWFLHGEARHRLEALWMAFEDARTGEKAEQSYYILHHLDPQMAVLFSPEGPFKYCTPAQHSDELAALPYAPAPADYSSRDRDDQDAVAHPAGLAVPSGPTVHHRRVVREFPG